MNHKDYIEACEKVNKLHQEASSAISKFPDSFFFEKMKGYAEALFERFAPFREGDRVMLVKVPEINEKDSWGWMCAKHFLVYGAKGTVKTVDLYKGKFQAGVVWDDDSWIDEHTKEIHPVKDKSLFNHSEDYLRVIGEMK